MSIDRYDPIRVLGEGSFGKVGWLTVPHHMEANADTNYVMYRFI